MSASMTEPTSAPRRPHSAIVAALFERHLDILLLNCITHLGQASLGRLTALTGHSDISVKARLCDLKTAGLIDSRYGEGGIHLWHPYDEDAPLSGLITHPFLVLWGLSSTAGYTPEDLATRLDADVSDVQSALEICQALVFVTELSTSAGKWLLTPRGARVLAEVDKGFADHELDVFKHPEMYDVLSPTMVRLQGRELVNLPPRGEQCKRNSVGDAVLDLYKARHPDRFEFDT